MAAIRLDNEHVCVQLSIAEKIGALHGNFQFPLSAVRAVRVVGKPFAEIGGVRFPGTRVPGLIALGTWRRRGGRDFVAVYRGASGIVVEVDADPPNYQRIIFSTKDPDGVRNLLAAAAPPA
jgi:hypothetical protein